MDTSTARLHGDLTVYESHIASADEALREAATCCVTMDTLQRRPECIAAMALRRAEGSNAEQRRARLTLALAEDTDYIAIVVDSV